MARPAPAVRSGPILTVLPGGRRDVTLPLDVIEEAYVEQQAIADDALRLGNLALDVARRIQVALYRERYGLAGQYADHLEQAVALHLARARKAKAEAQRAIERLDPDGAA